MPEDGLRSALLVLWKKGVQLMLRHPLIPHPAGMLVHTLGICGWPFFPWLPGLVSWILAQVTPLPPQSVQATSLYSLIGLVAATALPFVYAFAIKVLERSERESKRQAALEQALRRITELEGGLARTDEKATVAASTAAAVKAKAELSNETLKQMGKIEPPRDPETHSLLRRTLLIVEDSAQGMLQLTRFFERRGYDVTTAACFEEAVAAIDEPGRDPHWAIIDLKMPGEGDGLDLLRKLKAEEKQTRVVVYTGYSEPEVEKEARDLGVVEIVSKPTPPDHLWKIMRDTEERERTVRIGPE